MRSVLSLLLLAAAPAFAQGALRERSADPANPHLRIVSESVHVQIDGQYARTVLRQEFVNTSEARLEGVYVLRTASASVEGFAYWNGGEKIVGEVFERESARKLYEDVTGLRRDPGLLEQTGEGSFSFRVFPIEPGERKRIEVTFGQRLARRGRVLEYRLTLAGGDGEVVLDVADAHPIVALDSSSHALRSERLEPRAIRARAALRAGGPQDLIVRYEVDAAPWEPSVVVHRDAGQDPYVVVQLAAPAQLAQREVSEKDVTLVIDRSGSMSGAPLDEALAAAQSVVQRLRPGDRVNVLAFDQDVEALFATPQPVAQAREAALQYVRRIRVRGGTDIARALDRALQAQEPDHVPHLILFLTDGQSDSARALEVAQKDSGDARVFTIGLGAGVEKALLSRLAAMKRGRFTYIESPEAIEDRVGHLFDAIEAPALVGLSLEARGATLTDVYPRTLPDLSAGDDLCVTARVQGASAGQQVELVVHGMLGGTQLALPVSFVVPDVAAHPWAGRVWAKARIDDLLEEISLHGMVSGLRDEVIGLALAYNLASPYTAFLAVPETELDGAQAQTLAELRQQRRAALAARTDAAALSRWKMPPGDPVLTVTAPRDALQVTAYFPFGQVKDLAWDARLEKWTVRFLVPRGVSDGDYEATVVVVRRDGTIELLKAAYTIDSHAPDFEVTATPIAGGVHLRVLASEPARRVSALLIGAPLHRAELAGDGRVFEGDLRATAGTVRVVVADEARNESVREVRLP